MKFKKAPPLHTYIYVPTFRKIAAYERKIKQAQAANPLIADHVAAEFAPVSQVMSDRARQSIKQEQAWRNQRAAQWVKARARLRASPCKDEVYHKWQTRRWITRNPVDLLDMVWCAENPGIHHIPAWAYPKPTAAQISLTF
ncbi:MAG: hypothetical protein BWK73_10455 [Thiothrix lacustris]|uniref:Uncharacterized protein n=1 Tax=Thiothrix lacustris TaxID=525917 RepID=A0A1Y1QV83_9GAMM|nr:MAG: hypothetical protein BWK73_10455 [Thiothrix lacustris]